jgi:tricorn protease
MRLSRLAAALLLSAASVAVAPVAQAALPRFPQPYGDRIVFVADGNIWSVGKAGGEAVRLTSALGQDMMPRVSPDGRWIAYTEASKAGTDIWVIPAAGGAARRLTYNPTTEGGTGGRHGPDNMVVTWTPDSKSVVYLTKKDQWNSWVQYMYKIPVEGGLPKPMPIDSAVGLASFAPDGHTIAYNRIFRNFRTWKRYNGGLAQQIYTYDFNSRQLAQLTNWSGTNTSPMWYGRKIYYLSDQDQSRRANIWAYDLDAKTSREVTHFTDYDIDFPALGGDAIAFQQAGKLWLLDLKSEQAREVPVSVPDDNPRTRAHVTAMGDDVRDADPAGQVDYAIAPNGKRSVFSARGDIFSVPTENGATRDLTGTQGADEDHPVFSPDGKWIAYTTDAGGSQQVAVRPAEGGPERIVTSFAKGYFYGPIFSPDGRSLAFSDGEHHLWLAGVDGGAPKQVAQDKQSEIHDQSFSPDGRWLAFSMTAFDRRRDLWLYDIGAGALHRLGNGDEIDQAPVWSTDGKYLFFVSSRNENPVPADTDFDFAELKSAGIYAIPLARDTASPVAPKSDEADSGSSDEDKDKASDTGSKDKDKADKSDKSDKDKSGKSEDKSPPADKPGPIAPIRIDVDGMMGRAVALPIDPSNIFQLDARDHRVYYLTQPLQLIEGALKGEKSQLRYYDYKERRNKLVAEDVDSYALSLDGKKLLVKKDDDYTVLEAKENAAKDSDNTHKLDFGHMRMLVDPPQEWAEMFENAWRLQRDMFFSPVMNGQDWQAVHDKYKAIVPLLGSREDLNWLIGQMIGELSNSHTYVGGGDAGDTTEAVRPALLGVEWSLDAASGRYRIATIFPGDNTREDYRSPLTQPGLDVKVGDYVLAIDGVELKAPADPNGVLQLADPKATVDLSVSDTPNGPVRHVLVKPIRKEIGLRERAWIQHNREVVDRLSGGKVGYVYMSDMEQLGIQQFMRQFYAQLNKQALVIDDRWNGGGFIAPYAIERLRRELVALSVNREGAPGTEPEEVLNGPKVMLLNHWSASDGDIFPYLFKKYRLGQLVGTRSWGGVRGIRGNWRMMDGGYITIPEEAMYNTDSTWAVENHGVDPDIEVEDMPADLLAGHDAQLETAVGLMMKAIQGKPGGLPAPPPLLPAYPANGVVAPQP